MTTKTIIIGIIIVVAAIVVVFEYVHKKHVKYNEADLRESIIGLFGKQGSQTMSYDQFVAAIKRKYNISQKGATALVGKAQKYNIVSLQGRQVMLTQ